MANRVPVEVGQIRDVAESSERKRGVHRLARVVEIRGSPHAIGARAVIEGYPTGPRREKLIADLERCPLPFAAPPPAVVTREHYHALLDQAMDATREGESFVPLFIRLCAEATR